MNKEERVAELHTRINKRKHAKEARKQAGLSILSCGLFVGLVAVIAESGTKGGAVSTGYAGAAMLFTNAGGYVLTAVIAFTLGVLLTVLCIKNNKNRDEN